MNLQAVRRRLRSAGHDESAIEEMIDRLADEQVQEEKDRAIEENKRSLEADGYDLEALERDNYHNQWMHQ